MNIVYVFIVLIILLLVLILQKTHKNLGDILGNSGEKGIVILYILAILKNA